MFSKWIISIDGFEMYRFGEDKELYKLPYKKGGRSYGLKKVKKAKDKNRWKLNGVWWSDNQLRQHIIEDPDPIELTKCDLPF